MNEELKKTIKKYNKIYVIELFVIAAIILVLATLKILHVIGNSQNFRRVFNIITLVGATYIITDFIWLCCSKKRQKRNSWFDKLSVLPVAIALIVVDIICLINWEAEEISFYSTYISIVFYYIALVYILQGIYHLKKPAPSIVYAAYEEYNENLKKQADANKDKIESKEENKNEQTGN